MFQTRNMRKSRVQPTILRNRLTTNWVAVSNVASAPIRAPKRKPWLFGVLSMALLAVVLCLLAIRVELADSRVAKYQTQTSVQGFATAKPTSSLQLCSVENLIRRFDLLPKISTVTLGGVRFTRVECESQGYVASERRTTQGWQVNEISRSPSGDREISMDY